MAHNQEWKWEPNKDSQCNDELNLVRACHRTWVVGPCLVESVVGVAVESVALSSILGVERTMTTEDSILPELEEHNPVREVGENPPTHPSKIHPRNRGYKEHECTHTKHQGVFPVNLTMDFVLEVAIAAILLRSPDADVEGILLIHLLAGFCFL